MYPIQLNPKPFDPTRLAGLEKNQSYYWSISQSMCILGYDLRVPHAVISLYNLLFYFLKFLFFRNSELENIGRVWTWDQSQFLGLDHSPRVGPFLSPTSLYLPPPLITAFSHQRPRFQTNQPKLKKKRGAERDNGGFLFLSFFLLFFFCSLTLSAWSIAFFIWKRQSILLSFC